MPTLANTSTLELVAANTTPKIEIVQIDAGAPPYTGANGIYILAQDGHSIDAPTALSIAVDYSSFYSRIATALEKIANNSNIIVNNSNTIVNNSNTIVNHLSNVNSSLITVASEIETINASLATIATEIITIDTSLDANSSGSYANTITRHLDTTVQGSYANIVSSQFDTGNATITLANSIIQMSNNIGAINIDLSELSNEANTSNKFMKILADHYEVERAMNVSDLKYDEFNRPGFDQYGVVSVEINNPTKF